MKKKILIITYDFFPDNSPNTYRWLNVLKEWKEKTNIEIFVISSQKNNFENYEEHDGIYIYRTQNSILKILNKKLKNHNIQPVQQDDIKKGKSIVRIIYDLTWTNFYFPDFAFLWQKPAYKMAEKLIAEKNIHNVITVSWPFSDHVVGYKLKKKYNINWIADTIDPFYLSSAVNNASLYRKINKLYENKILSKANAISLLTDKLKKKYSEIYPSLRDKITVNHNVFVPYTIPENQKSIEKNSTVLVFVGTLSPITRSPESLLSIFDGLVKLNMDNDKNLELHLYGNLESCANDFIKYDYLIGKNLFLHNFTSREKITRILQNADAVVNIGNKNAFQEPSKIVEYVFLKKKILNICSIFDDTSKEMLVNYPLHLNLFPQDCNSNEVLLTTLSFINNSIDVQNVSIDNIIDKYLLSNVEKKYFELLKFDNE